jgi:hypothetical protein
MSSTDDKNSTLGLPGLQSIRSFLAVKSKYIADETGYSAKWISEIENGNRDCSQKLQRRIASILCCTLADLNGKPDEARLNFIKRSYHLHQAGEPAQGVA